MSPPSVIQRPPMLPLARGVRAYFAPVERDSAAPAVFAPGKHGAFPLDAPPAPWVSAGWIENFRRTPATRSECLRAGPKGAAAAQFRAQLEARVEFDFLEWGKLQMALAGGSQHMNVLAEDLNSEPQPSGGVPLSAVAVQPGSTASEIVLGTGTVDFFAAGDLVAVDLDYQQQTGHVGSGIAAAYVRDPMEVLLDPHYIRRVTFNVGRVESKTSTALVLAQPLLGGAPPAGAQAQKVVAFVDREGGSFFQQWSALFVLPEESGGRVCFYYPRLESAAPARETSFEIAAPLAGCALHAAFLALPYTDINDSEQVVCYRSYFPAATAALY
ncbi:MAG TPA: hypothetical protein VE825_17755 [Terriglobales bacterium]|nr:hypothetical protein [Terriglobales bacterium]